MSYQPSYGSPIPPRDNPVPCPPKEDMKEVKKLIETMAKEAVKKGDTMFGRQDIGRINDLIKNLAEYEKAKQGNTVVIIVKEQSKK